MPAIRSRSSSRYTPMLTRARASGHSNSSTSTRASGHSNTSTLTRASTSPSSSTLTRASTRSSSSTLTQASTSPSSSTLTQASTRSSSSTLTQASTSPSSSTLTRASTRSSSSTLTRASTRSSSSTLTQASTSPSSSTLTQASTSPSSSTVTRSQALPQLSLSMPARPQASSSTSSSSTTQLYSGFAEGTLFNTPQGERLVQDLAPGDLVLDPQGFPVEVLAVGPPKMVMVKRVSYTKFSSLTKVHFDCSANQVLPFVVCAAAPSLRGYQNRVYWLTRCRRSPVLPLPVPASILPEDVTKFQDVRSGLSFRRKCPKHPIGGCAGLFIVNRTFKDNEQAQRFLALLESPDAGWVDPDLVLSGDIFRLSVYSFDDICLTIANKNRHLKLFRSPLGVGGPAPSKSQLRLDPYFLGLWLGDGSVNKPRVTSAEPEIERWLQLYVDEVSRTTGTEHHLRKELSARAGETNASGIKTTKDVFDFYISTRKGSRDVNKISEALEALGLFSTKVLGIPNEIMQTSEANKLKLLAGLIDADGHMCTVCNRYELTQFGDEHKQIIYKAKALAISVGISVTGVYCTARTVKVGSKTYNLSAYRIHLTHNADKIGQYLQIQKKRFDQAKKQCSADTRPVDISDGGQKLVHPFEVVGGLVQLADRVVVHS